MARPLLCVTVAAPTLAELRARRDAADDADLVELRLDAVSDPNVAGALAGRRRPVIVTCRPTREGGAFGGSEEERHAILAAALAQGAEYVDVEWDAGVSELVRRDASRVIVSFHAFSGVPARLDDVVRAMRSSGARTIKVAVHANCLSDCLSLQRLATPADDSRQHVFVAMGDAGLVTRALPDRLGSAWTYAGSMTAVGQLPVDRLLGEFRYRVLSSQARLYGIIGSPLGHSISPAMHNAAFAAKGIDAVYLPLHARDVDDFFRFAEAYDVKGASVTTPFKVDVCARLDHVEEPARRLGAVNTIRCEAGRWLGTNTDVDGFLVPLQNRLSLADTRVAVLGAGGAARAVAVALSGSGAAVTVYARNPERAGEVARMAGARSAALPPPPRSWDLLVNATSAGMYPNIDETPLPGDRLDGRMVYDLVYNPPQTRLLREAASAGLDTLGGLEMLVAQAGRQLEWWTGCSPAPALLRQAALARLATFQ